MSYLYLAPNMEKTAFKIGYSTSPLTRLPMVMGDIDLANTYLFSCENAAIVESFCHKHFKEFNKQIYPKGSDGYTEWFDINIFKLAKTLIIRNDTLLGIIKHIPYGTEFPTEKVVNDQSVLPKKYTRTYDTEVDGVLVEAHRKNYSNLMYLLEHFNDFKWEGDCGTLRVKYFPAEYERMGKFLSHNEYIRDSGWYHGFFSIMAKYDYVTSKDVIIEFNRLSIKDIKRASSLDLRLDCVIGMVERLKAHF